MVLVCISVEQDWWYWMSFHILTSHLYIFQKMSFKSSGCFKMCVLSYFILWMFYSLVLALVLIFWEGSNLVDQAGLKLEAILVPQRYMPPHLAVFYCYCVSFLCILDTILLSNILFVNILSHCMCIFTFLIVPFDE